MNEPVAPNVPDPLTAPCFVIDDFLPKDVALSMRADIEAHFAEPENHRPDTHQVWNYWFVAGIYTYLRTVPEKIIRQEKVETFMSKLRDFTEQRMGIGGITWPFLSLYIPGCYQNLHNDSLNGRFAFVYSLTNSVRKTVGGGTIVMTEDSPFRRGLAGPEVLPGFCEIVEPRFNRLVLFDDRAIHGVERIEGSMDPLEGRFVLHGHIQDDGPLVSGTQTIDGLLPVIQAGLNGFVASYGEAAYNFHGPLNVRFTVEADGQVSGLHVLLDRVTHISERYAGLWHDLRPLYLAVIADLRFAPAAGPTTVVFPIAFSGSAGRPLAV